MNQFREEKIAISKMAKNQFLDWKKSLKLPKMQFYEKKIFY